MRARFPVIGALSLVAGFAALAGSTPQTSRLGPAAVQSAAQTFTGVITDSECDDGFHGAMRMGDTDAECVVACVDAHGARYVLHTTDEKTAYELSDQKKAGSFAARSVVVTGRLDASTRTIAVESIAPTP
ncbi:MAG: DUF5818 domain-containing protein [Vicinamibacterales bacterium]